MAFGLFLSAICPTENAALQAAVAAFYPTILLSGKLLHTKPKNKTKQKKNKKKTKKKPL